MLGSDTLYFTWKNTGNHRSGGQRFNGPLKKDKSIIHCNFEIFQVLLMFYEVFYDCS